MLKFRTTPKPPLVRVALLWLALALTLAVVAQFPHTPVWVPAVCLLLLGWKLLLVFWPPLKRLQSAAIIRLLHNMLALLLIIGVYMNFGTLLGRDAGVALLIVLTGFKFLEAHTTRDQYVTTALALFLIVTHFFYSQTLLTGGWMLVVVLLLVTTLVSLNDPDQVLPVRQKMKLSGMLIAQALPLMLIAFVFFPRAPGPLWGLPDDAHSGMTGLSDEMVPGSISQLGQSDEVAFRVEFRDVVPEKSELYWRGPVLWDTDGRKWTRGQSRIKGLAEIHNQGIPVSYSITIEPHDEQWIFALDMPEKAPDGTRLTRDFQMLADKPIRRRDRYDLVAFPDYTTSGADPADFERALALPANRHPRAVALGKRWRENNPDIESIVDKALTLFREQEFFYTLAPPLMTDDPVDEFLFDIREGFCEHYAAALTILMRAAGIPARVVTGYQGGQINPVGDYLVVRQYDAHAWVEIWQDDQGWQRVDPTAAVSPARIRSGISSALPDNLIDVPLGLSRGSFAAELLQQLRDNWDAVNNQWNQWVLGYSQSRQLELLGKIGIGNGGWRELATWLAGIIATLFILLALSLLRPQSRQLDQARRYYEQFCKKLARHGIQRYSHEGPRDFARRAITDIGQQSGSIEEITDRYIEVRYLGHTDKLQSLRDAVRRFSPSRQ